MEFIKDEGNGRNLPLFNAIKSTGTFLERYETPKPKKKPKSGSSGAAAAAPPPPPKK